MAFMQKQIDYFTAWQVETTCGTEIVPCYVTDAAGLPTYLSGTPLQFDAGDGGQAKVWPVCERIKGWFARLSALGYMDCTDWSGPFESEKEAEDYLCEMYDAEDAD